ncbi:MAG: DUF4278 domain-containing protein [Cyanobacteria bacterium J069]|nr:MAG: DUF4278 domain-containing protein [Cyanobacteria bacterium J069]
MSLIYRGTDYTPSNALPATSHTLTGRYRGTEMTMHYSSQLPAQPFVNLTYRGVQYRPETTPSFSHAAAIAL